jgi:PIN domain nuclease of toxin-antitoxin system
VRALLDTHAFLWSIVEPERLSERARHFIKDSANEIFLSAASAWEIAIKYRKGRIELPEDVASVVTSGISDLGLRTLPIEMRHALRVAGLPLLHADPFDRILIAQAKLEAFPLITADPNIARYAVETVW